MAGNRHRSQRILLVDDNPADLMLMEEELKREGYGVLIASNSEAALDIVEHHKVDCIAVERTMPRIAGPAFCSRVCEVCEKNGSLLPILIVTGDATKANMIEALEAGADDLVEKSDDCTVLKAKVRASLRHRRLQDERNRINPDLRDNGPEFLTEGAEHEAKQACQKPVEHDDVANFELEAANRELKETHAQLLHSAKLVSLGELVVGIAHEVNNPLAYIMSHVRTIASALKFVAEDAQGKLSKAATSKLNKVCQRTEDISDGLARVQKLMTKLRTFSRLDDGVFHEADVSECIETTLPLIRHQLNNGIELETRYTDDNRIYCSAGLLNQAVLNLLTNAIDAIGGQGRIVIETRREGNEFCLTVADSGTGVPDDLQARIFEPFFTTKDIGKGTGMGLAICYRIVDRHRGRIEVGKSEMGGAQFTIRIPLDRAEHIDAA